MERVISSRREQQVSEFQVKFGSPGPFLIGEEESCRSEEADDALKSVVQILELAEESLKLAHHRTRDPRAMRVKLMVSELSEVVAALATRDEVELADGLADLEYVAVGTATTFGLPIGEVFDEVHRSNMTKSAAGEAVREHSGDKGKGPGYSPPDIRLAVERGRSRRWEYKRGDQLATRDGRIIGNVTVTHVEKNSDLDRVVSYEVLSDYGRNSCHTPEEMRELFYAEPVAERSLRNT